MFRTVLFSIVFFIASPPTPIKGSSLCEKLSKKTKKLLTEGQMNAVSLAAKNSDFDVSVVFCVTQLPSLLGLSTDHSSSVGQATFAATSRGGAQLIQKTLHS